MAVDKNGKPLGVPKPVSTKKQRAPKGSPPKKTVDMTAVDRKLEERVARGKQSKNFGKSVERAVAAVTGGHRVPASGAIKNSVFNLEGDVRVPHPERPRDTLVLIECKGTSGIAPSGDKSFSLKKSVLDQATQEAELQGAIGLVYIHWKNANYLTDDYCVMKSNHFIRLLELAKLGILVEEGKS